MDHFRVEGSDIVFRNAIRRQEERVILLRLILMGVYITSEDGN